MKTSLSHLPEEKQEDLEELTKIIVEDVPAEMVILFGSHARGDWVEDYQQHYEYVSDYDILVITKDRKSAKEGKNWWDLSKKLNAHEESIRTTIIQHSIGFVNDKIERNEYFFVDILKEGIMLYDSGKFKLSEPKAMNAEQRQKKAREQFEPWFESANHFFEGFEFNFHKGETKHSYYNIAVFELHQATERYYTAILLVFTDYKPKLHDIKKLGNQVEKLHAGFSAAFPKKTPEEERLFELLRDAYIDSRYKLNYTIEKAELEYLSDRVKVLKELTERICKERIAQFTKA